MKNLILVGLVAFVSWQAMASDCPLRKGGHLLSAANDAANEVWLPGSHSAVKPTPPAYVKPGVQGAGTDSIKR